MCLLTTAATPPSAIAKDSQNCSSGNNLGLKIPVVLVHGFNNSPSVWGTDSQSGSMYKSLGDISGAIRDTFDYKSFSQDWVTDPHIGPALAERIDCLSQASLQGGGAGKVIVVAHSMGGLATRFAAAQTVNGHKIADELGLVVTLGTPNAGTSLASAGLQLATQLCITDQLGVTPTLNGSIDRANCPAVGVLNGSAVTAMVADSQELKALPPFPNNVPVKAIAGDVRAVFDVGLMKIEILAEGDTFVSVKSATAEFTQTGVGDGEKTFTCEGLVIPLISKAPCSHNQLPSNPAVQQEVKASIDQYLASVTSAPAPAGPLIDVYGIKLPLDPSWDVEEASGVAGIYKDSGSPLLSVVGPRLAGNGASIQDATHCTSVSQKGSVAISGRSATYYEATGCSSGQNKRVWKLANPSVIVESSDTSGVIDTLLKGARF